MDEQKLDKYVLKTGTLTIGIICKEGIVLAADNRQTYGGEGGVSYIAGTSEKIHKINERTLATTAGTASDSRRTLKMISAEIKLKELKDKQKITIKETASLMSNILFKNIRTPSMIPSIAHFLIAGHDEDGKCSLYDASPDGYLQKIETYQATGAPFESLGILDIEYKKTITLEEGIELAKKTFEATKGRQPGVGDGFDIYTVTPEKITKVFSKKIRTELVEKIEKDHN
jgi:proteasome beta subunit